jgi:hypothetical protein
MNVKIIFFFILFFISCAGEQVKKELNEVYIPSGAEQYFLPNLPHWANVSTAADCRRETNIRFFDFYKMNKSYNLSYEQLLQFQLLYNHELFSILKNAPKNIEPKIRDEEVLFFNILEKIQGGSTLFLAPDFKNINLVWVDDTINDKINISRLKKLMNSEAMEQGMPVLVSSCLTWNELESFLGEVGLPETTKIISAELFSPFAQDFILGIRTSLDFDKLFKDNQKLYFYTNRDGIPTEIRGHLRLKKF